MATDLHTLKESLWPNYKEFNVSNLLELKIKIEVQTLKTLFLKLSLCLEELGPGEESKFNSALESFPPLRIFVKLKLFEARLIIPASNILKFQMDVCRKFIILHQHLVRQQPNNTLSTKTLLKESFDDLCKLVVEVLDPSVFADKQRFPGSMSDSGLGPLGVGSANTSSWWGRLGATAAVTTAAYAAYAKYATSSYNWTVANAGDLASILPLAFGAVRGGPQSITSSKMIAAMLTAATQMSCSTRSVDSGAWGSALYRVTGMSGIGAPGTIPLNILPVVVSGLLPGGQPPTGSMVGLFAANLYLTAQDYVNIPSISTLPTGDAGPYQAIEGLLDLYTKHVKSVSYMAAWGDTQTEFSGLLDLKNNFILPYLMNPAQISNKFLSTFAGMEKGKYSKITKDLYPSIKAYFQNVSGTTIKHPSYYVVDHYAEYHAATLNALDRVVASKLEHGERDSLIKYIDGPMDFLLIPHIEYNIQLFIDVMQYKGQPYTPEDLKQFKKLLAPKNFLHLHQVQQLENPLRVLLFSMFQGRNPELRATSESFLKKMLDNQKVKMIYDESHDIRLVAKLSTYIFDQPAYCQIMDKGMMGFFDDRLFYKALIDPILLEADNKMKYRGQQTKLEQFHFAETIENQMKILPIIQTELIHELVLKIENAAKDSVFSVESKAQILKNMYLIDNPHFEHGDGGFTVGDVLNLGDGEENSFASQSKGHHWRMMRLFALIRSKNDVMDASDLSKPFYSKELEIKFNEFYKNLYENCTHCMFPAAKHSIFLFLWRNATYLAHPQHNMSFEFLKEMYNQNKSLFWIPILSLVIKGEAIPMEYWEISEKIIIPDSDAASYLDFLCRWVYPLSYNSAQKQKLLDFSKVLSEDGGFRSLSSESYYLSQKLLVENEETKN